MTSACASMIFFIVKLKVCTSEIYFTDSNSITRSSSGIIGRSAPLNWHMLASSAVTTTKSPCNDACLKRWICPAWRRSNTPNVINFFILDPPIAFTYPCVKAQISILSVPILVPSTLYPFPSNISTNHWTL